MYLTFEAEKLAACFDICNWYCNLLYVLTLYVSRKLEADFNIIFKL